jgi:hypothetical protein
VALRSKRQRVVAAGTVSRNQAARANAGGATPSANMQQYALLNFIAPCQGERDLVGKSCGCPTGVPSSPTTRAGFPESAVRSSGFSNEMLAAIEQVNGLSPRGTVRERSDASGEVGVCSLSGTGFALLIGPGARASRPPFRARKETAGEMLPLRG